MDELDGTNWDLGGTDGTPKMKEGTVLDVLKAESITETMGRRSPVII